MYYKGQCKTHIRRKEGSGDHRRTVNYRSTEQYFDYKVVKQKCNCETLICVNVTNFWSINGLPPIHQAYLCGGPGSEFELEPGYYEYPFQFTLPPDLPSSFEGSHGKVRHGDSESILGFSLHSEYSDSRCLSAFMIFYGCLLKRTAY